MIEVKEISKFYGSKENRFQVLKSINLKIKEGDFAVILGASGSGKSTLLNVISGLERPVSYIGFVIGTFYQYFLLRITVDVFFADFENVPEYIFDYQGLVISFITFIAAYEIIIYVYSKKIEKLSVKSIMLE